jgi:hypothetical protein
VTPDLYKPMYSAKVVAFFDKLMDKQFANKPFMRHYLDYYFDLYWDLHLGVTGDAILRSQPNVHGSDTSTSVECSRRNGCY